MTSMHRGGKVEVHAFLVFILFGAEETCLHSITSVIHRMRGSMDTKTSVNKAMVKRKIPADAKIKWHPYSTY